jgi:hypothetical protein
VGFPVGNQVDFMLSLLRLKAVLGSAVVADTATAQDDDDGPHQPEPWGVGRQGREACTHSEHQPDRMGQLSNKKVPNPAHIVEADTVGSHCYFMFKPWIHKCLDS